MHEQGLTAFGVWCRFVTFSSPESVERVTAVAHTLHGQELAIDKATPKDRGNAYLAAAAARNVRFCRAQSFSCHGLQS